MNHLIRITPVRVVGPDNEQIGVIETSEALKMAVEKGLDLVEVVPDSRPPVCKIMDYGKFKYEQSKEGKNKGSKAAEMKQVRLGRSVKIDPHDVQIRIDQSRRFLLAGHKVQIVQRFRGREIAHRELGLEHLRECVDKLGDIAKVEQTPRWFGKEASIILSPDRVKIEAIKRKAEKEQAAKAKAEGAAAPAAPAAAAAAAPAPAAGAAPSAPKPTSPAPVVAAAPASATATATVSVRPSK